MSPAGTPAGTYNVVWTGYNYAYFEGTGGTVNLSTASANTLTFNADGDHNPRHAESRRAVRRAVLHGQLKDTTTIASTFTHNGGPTNWSKPGTGTLNFGGTDTGATGGVTISGGTLGILSGATLTARGGTCSAAATGLNISGGSVTLSAPPLNNSSGTAGLTMSGDHNHQREFAREQWDVSDRHFQH